MIFPLQWLKLKVSKHTRFHQFLTSIEAVMAFEQEMSSLSIRAIFRAWLWATTTIQAWKTPQPWDLGGPAHHVIRSHGFSCPRTKK